MYLPLSRGWPRGPRTRTRRSDSRARPTKPTTRGKKRIWRTSTGNVETWCTWRASRPRPSARTLPVANAASCFPLRSTFSSFTRFHRVSSSFFEFLSFLLYVSWYFSSHTIEFPRYPVALLTTVLTSFFPEEKLQRFSKTFRNIRSLLVNVRGWFFHGLVAEFRWSKAESSV